MGYIFAIKIFNSGTLEFYPNHVIQDHCLFSRFPLKRGIFLHHYFSAFLFPWPFVFTRSQSNHIYNPFYNQGYQINLKKSLACMCNWVLLQNLFIGNTQHIILVLQETLSIDP